MRKLEIVIARAPGAAPVLLAAALVGGAASCGGSSVSAPADASAGGATGGSGGNGFGGGSGGLVFGGAGGTGGTGGTGGIGGSPFCPSSSHFDTQIVTVPDPGVPADPGQICAVSTAPVVSNAAARVSLMKYSPALELAQGTVTLDPNLAGGVAGSLAISVVASTPSALQAMQVDSIVQTPTGWTFHATWPAPLDLHPDGYTSITVRVQFLVNCDPSGNVNQLVSADTVIDLCLGDSDLDWVSSGDLCTVCHLVAEMAPSPIVPEPKPDTLPLARVLRLRLAELARVGDDVVLLAENDGGEALAYEWHPSSGSIEALAPDIVIWRSAAGTSPRFIQTAVVGDAGAAVASFSLDEAA
jgi:hypothetical protein